MARTKSRLELHSSDLAVWLMIHYAGGKWEATIFKRWGVAGRELVNWLSGGRPISSRSLARIAQDTGIPMEILESQAQQAGLKRVRAKLPTAPAKRKAIYVATWFPLKRFAEFVGRSLRMRGHRITHAWWDVEGDKPVLGGQGSGKWLPMHKGFAENDLKGVINATAVVMLVPESGGCGMWVEMGAALAFGIPVYQIKIGQDGFLGGAAVPARGIFDTLAIQVNSLDELFDKLKEDK